MGATDPVVTFLLVLVFGIVAGILFDRLAGPSWLARQFSGSTRGIITSALRFGSTAESTPSNSPHGTRVARRRAGPGVPRPH